MLAAAREEGGFYAAGGAGHQRGATAYDSETATVLPSPAACSAWCFRLAFAFASAWRFRVQQQCRSRRAAGPPAAGPAARTDRRSGTHAAASLTDRCPGTHAAAPPRRVLPPPAAAGIAGWPRTLLRGPTRCPHPRTAPNPARQPGPAAIAGEAGLLRPVGPWIADPRRGTQLVSSRLGSKSLGQCTAGMLRFGRLMPRPCAPRTSHRPCVPQPPPPCAVPALPGPRRRPAARRWTCVTWRTGSRWTGGAATLCPVGWG